MCSRCMYMWLTIGGVRQVVQPPIHYVEVDGVDCGVVGLHVCRLHDGLLQPGLVIGCQAAGDDEMVNNIVQLKPT